MKLTIMDKLGISFEGRFLKLTGFVGLREMAEKVAMGRASEEGRMMRDIVTSAAMANRAGSFDILGFEFEWRKEGL